MSFGKAFGQSFNEGFNMTFRTKAQKEAEKQEAELRQIKIDEGKLKLDMAKTQQLHQKAVESWVSSGHDPEVFANVLSDYHPNDTDYKYEGKDQGNLSFTAGQYRRNEDGTYARNPDTGGKIFEPHVDKDGTRQTKVIAEKDYMTEAGMRLAPQAWLGHHLKTASEIEQRRFQLGLVEKKGEVQKDVQKDVQKAGFEGKGKLQKSDQEVKQSESSLQRAHEIELQKLKNKGALAGRKTGGSKSTKEKTTFYTGTGKSRKGHEVNSKDFTKFTNKAKAVNKSLMDSQASERDMWILENLQGSKKWRERVSSYKDTGEGRDSLIKALTNYGMDDKLAIELVDQIPAGGGDSDSGSIWGWLF